MRGKVTAIAPFLQRRPARAEERETRSEPRSDPLLLLLLEPCSTLCCSTNWRPSWESVRLVPIVRARSESRGQRLTSTRTVPPAGDPARRRAGRGELLPAARPQEGHEQRRRRAVQLALIIRICRALRAARARRARLAFPSQERLVRWLARSLASALYQRQAATRYTCRGTTGSYNDKAGVYVTKEREGLEHSARRRGRRRSARDEQS